MEVSEIRDFLFNRPRRAVLIVLCVALVGMGLAIFFFSRYQQSKVEREKAKETSQEASSDETKVLVEKVGELLELPEEEVPTVATVADVTKLQDQVFFKNAQNGDKVLVYTKANKAVLYRPATGKIIEVTTLRKEEGF